MLHYREQRVKDELYNAHAEKFAFIERVIESCQTEEQALNAYKWGTTILFGIERFECEKRRGTPASRIIMGYMRHRREIVDEIYSRKKSIIKH
jgi:hypothetical protein